MVLGALVALTALTRGEALLLLPLVLIPVLWRRGSARGAWRAAGRRAGRLPVVLTPWTARNWIVFNRPVAIATNSGTAVAGANCAVTYASGDHLGGWYPPCIKEHPGKNEAEHHAEALSDGVRYARHHAGPAAGRAGGALRPRLERLQAVRDPRGPLGARPEAGRDDLLPAGAIRPAAGVPAAAARGGDVDPAVAPFIIVAVTALTTYGNLRFREPAEICTGGAGRDRRRRARCGGGGPA